MKPIIKHCKSCCLALAMATALLATLASCSKDEATDDTLPPGKYPITFTATMQGLTVQKAASRATTGGSWAGNEEVAVQIGTEVKKYTAAANGALTVATGVTPWYWQNTTEQKTVSAWYPHSAAQPTTFTVQTDQSGGGYQSSDLIYATPTIISFGSNALTFRHLPAKVVVNLKADTQNGVTEDEVTNATVAIVNQATTSGTIAPDWSVAQTAPGNSIITPNMLTTTASGYQKSVQALLVPQQMQNRKFIKVTINGNDYYYTPVGDNDANLESGKQYTYAITVKKTGIAVTVKDNGVAWSDNITSGDISVADFRITVPSGCTVSSILGIVKQESNYWALSGSNEFQLKIPKEDGKILKGVSATGIYTLLSWAKDGNGDYVITYKIRSNVTLTSEGFANKTTPQVGDYYYGDGEWWSELLPNKTCIGIVFKTGTGTNDNVSNYGSKLPQIQGYVVALRDAPGDRQPFGSGADISQFTTSTTDFTGYTRTQEMSQQTDFSLATHWACYSALNYSPVAPAGTSEWYLPSLGEWNVLWQNYGTVQEKLKAAGTDMKKNWGFYWSMSKKESGNTSPALVDFGAWNGSNSFSEKVMNNNSTSYSRPVLTF